MENYSHQEINRWNIKNTVNSWNIHHKGHVNSGREWAYYNMDDTRIIIEELLEDRFVYPTGMRALNILVPRLVDSDYFSPGAHTKQYREILISKLNEYPEWFFPKSRAQFVQFLYKVREVLGEGVLRNFYEVERHSSDVFTYFPYKNTAKHALIGNISSNHVES